MVTAHLSCHVVLALQNRNRFHFHKAGELTKKIDFYINGPSKQRMARYLDTWGLIMLNHCILRFPSRSHLSFYRLALNGHSTDIIKECWSSTAKEQEVIPACRRLTLQPVPQVLMILNLLHPSQQTVFLFIISLLCIYLSLLNYTN